MNSVDLTELATQTIQRLTSLWDVEGVQPAEREATLADLTKKVRAVYTSTVEDAEQARVALVREIERVKAEFDSIVAQLGAEDVSIVDDSQQTLRARLAAVNEQLAKLEQAKQEQIARIDAALTSLNALWSQVIQPNLCFPIIRNF